MHSGGVPFSHAHQLRLRGKISMPGYASSCEMRAKMTHPAPSNRIVTDRRKKARARDSEVRVSPLLPVCSRVSLRELCVSSLLCLSASEPSAIMVWYEIRARNFTFVKRTGRIRNGNLSGDSGSRLYAEGSEPKRSEAFGIQRQEKCSAGFLSARLEPGVHERACLLRQRHEAFRAARCTGARHQRGQCLVAQSFRGKDGHSLPVARRLPAARRRRRKIRSVSARERNHGARHRDYRPLRKTRLVQKLRHPHGSGPEGSFRRAGEGQLVFRKLN